MSEDFIEKVTIKFSNSKPVEVIDFLTSIQSFKKEYESTVKQMGFKVGDNDMKLYICVREGSIEWEFTRILESKPVQATLGFIGNKVLLKTWERITGIFTKAEGEESIKEEGLEELENGKGVLQPSRNDLSSKMSLKYEDRIEKIELNYEIQGASGRGVHDKICEIIGEKRIPNNDSFENKILQLSIVSTQKSTAIRGIIEDYDSNSHQLLLSKEMQETIPSEKKPFEGCYLVSGDIKTAKGKIVLYHIKKMEKIEP